MRLTDIGKTYGSKTVLDGLSLEIKEGEITCILGKSGAGKTTLLNALAGIIDFDGEVVPRIERVGYVFQDNRLLPYMTVRQNLQFVGGRDEVIEELLPECGLEFFAERKAVNLSGGEKRRVELLRAFCVEADAVLLDEPFSALDTVTKEKILALAHRLIREKKKTAVFVTHDLDEALRFADKIALLDEGKIVFEMDLPKTDALRPYASLSKERALLLEKMN